jgi:Skp family chaperone for outer membrane proteins
MKTLRLIVVSAIFTTIFALSTFAQTTGRAGIIDARFFDDEKQGITKLVTATATVEAEFKVKGAELKAMQDKMATTAKDGQAMQKAFTDNPKGPIGESQIRAKADELEKLQIEFKRKQEDASVAYSRRLQQLTGPIYDDIQTALVEFSKKNGFSMLLDARPFGQTQENPDGVSIFMYVDEKANVTADFIAFCNAKFSAPATPKPATPK